MINPTPPNAIAADYTSQVGAAGKQEKQAEEKKITVQNSEESEKFRFEREKYQEEKRKKKNSSEEKGDTPQEEKEARTETKHLVDIMV